MSARSQDPDVGSCTAPAERTRRTSSPGSFEGLALARELVRSACLAPSSHNTQCWKFAIEDKAISIRPDQSRHCPAVDPDDHHVFVSLRCAAENMVQAARAHIAGVGLLHGAVLGLLTVFDMDDTPALARDELMRYFAEAAWHPTALLPSQGVRWEAVDDSSAHAALQLSCCSP